MPLEQVGDQWDSFPYSDTPPGPEEHAMFDTHRVDSGFDGERARPPCYEHVYQGGRLGDPAFDPLLRGVRSAVAPPDGVTASSRDLVDRRTWARSTFVQEGMRGCGPGEYVLSIRFLYVLRCVVGFYVARPWGEKPFTAREVALVELAHAEARRAMRPPSGAAFASLPNEGRSMTFQLPAAEPVVALFDVRRGTPADVAALERLLSSFDDPSCSGVAVYVGVDDDKILTYGQWSGGEALASWLASRGPDLARLGRATRWGARAYRLHASANRGEVDLTGPEAEIVHTGLFALRDPRRQQEMLDRGAAAADEAVAHAPGLLTANFHGSLDGGYVINFGCWTDENAFRALAARPPFRANYWQDLADNEPGLYRRDYVRAAAAAAGAP